MKLKKPLKRLVASTVEPTPVEVPTPVRYFRIQVQQRETKYPEIWYDLKDPSTKGIFETPRLDVAKRIRDAFASITRMRYRIVRVIEIDLR